WFPQPHFMGFNLPDQALFPTVQLTSHRAAQDSVHSRKAIQNFSLNNGRGEDYFPGFHGGEIPGILRHQAVYERCPAARVPNDKNRLANFLLAVTTEEDIVQEKAYPTGNFQWNVEQE